MKIICIDSGLASEHSLSWLEEVTKSGHGIHSFSCWGQLILQWVYKWLQFHCCCIWHLMQNKLRHTKEKGRPVLRSGTKPSFCCHVQVMLLGIADDPGKSWWEPHSYLPFIWEVCFNWIFILHGSDPRYQYPPNPYSQGGKGERWRPFVPLQGLQSW